MDQLIWHRPRWYARLAGLTVLGAILRTYHLGSNAYWLDEAISVLIARFPVSLILSNAGRSSHPGLYYLLLHYWLRPGGSEAWARGLSLFWGVLTVPAMFVLGTLLFNRRVALLASAMLALAPFHVAYSQEARMYTQLACLAVVALVCFYRAMESGSLYWWLAMAVATTAAVATHLFSFFLLAAMNAHVLLYRRDRLVKLVVVNLVAAVIVGPHLMSMLGGNQHRLGGLRPLTADVRPSIFFPLTTIHLLLIGYSITPRLMPVALFSSLSVCVVTFWEVARAISRRPRKEQSLVLLALVVGITLLGPFTLAQIQPIFLPERTLLLALPSMLLLIAWGISEVEWKMPLPALAAGLAVVMIAALWGYYMHPDFQKPPMRDAAMLVQKRLEGRDAVLHTSDGSYLPFLIYVDHSDSFLLRDDPDARKSEVVYRVWGGQLVSKGDLRGRFERLWLVVALDHSVEFQREALAWFKGRYPLIEQHDIGGIGVYLLDLSAMELPGQHSPPVKASGEPCNDEMDAMHVLVPEPSAY